MHKIYKKRLSRLFTFPVFIFTGIILFAVISIFGSRWISGSRLFDLGSSVNCEKTGANGGGIPWQGTGTEVFSRMVGMRWYQGLIDHEGDKGRVVAAIKDANKYGIKLILRICWKGQPNPCPWEAANASEYADFLNDVASQVGDIEFWAIAGHNEPNAGEPRDVNDERSFMETVIRNVDAPNIHLLSPIMDLHHSDGNSFKSYLSGLNSNNALNDPKIEGIAGNAYEQGLPNNTLKERVNDFVGWLDSQGIRKRVFITETGPWESKNFEDFRKAYRELIQNEKIEAMLFFKPKGLNDDGPHMSLEEVYQVIPNCTEAFADYTGPINECAFEQDHIRSCESTGKGLGVGRGIVLKNDGGFKWSSEWLATAKIKNLTGMGFFSSTNYTGGGSEDFQSQGSTINRNSIGSLPDPDTGERLLYDTSINVAGYGSIIQEGQAVVGRVQYEDGSGILLGSIGNWEDPLETYQVPRQFILPEGTTWGKANNKTESRHISDQIPQYSPEKHCGKRIDGIYAGSSTSGYESVIDTGEYSYTIEEIVNKSNLKGSCEMESGQCKIDTDLSVCSSVVNNRDQLKKCLLANFPDGIWVRHSIPYGGFKLNGAGHILKAAWKKVHMFNPYKPDEKRICHRKNIGIMSEVETKLYDKDDDCGGLGTSCGSNNLLHNSTFSEGMWNPTNKPEWSGLGVNWYPFWNNSDDGAKAPEYEVINPVTRPGNGPYQKSFSKSTFHDAGIFQPIEFSTALSANDKIHVTARVQSYVASGASNGFEATKDFKMMVGVVERNVAGELSKSGPADEPYVLNDFNNYMQGVSAVTTQENSAPSAPGWENIEFTYKVSGGGTKAISVFLRGYVGGGYDQINSFWDDICVSVAGKPGITNTIAKGKPITPSPGDPLSYAGYCQPDQELMESCSFDEKQHPGGTGNLTSYYPYLGTVLYSMRDVDTRQYNIGIINEDSNLTQDDKEQMLAEYQLKDCSEYDDNEDYPVLCYCDEGKYDPVGIYLYSQGLIDKDELALAGIPTDQASKYASGDDDYSEPGFYAPGITQKMWKLLELVSKKVKEETGKCIPKEMLAAVMSIETHVGYNPDSLDQKFYAQNSSWCDRINNACSGETTPNEADDITIKNSLDRLSTKDGSYCKSDWDKIPSNMQSCKDERSAGVQCCDVRGPMQFKIGTWVGYRDKQALKNIRTFILDKYNKDTSLPIDRARLIDSLVAAGIKLSASCDAWKNNEQQTVKKKASEYWGSGDTEGMYARKTWYRYQAYKYGRVTAPVYTGECNEIFEAVKGEFLKRGFPVSYVQYRNSTDWIFCGAKGNYIECNPNSGISEWCRSCPIKATALFRHEFNHKLGGSSYFGNNKLSEFAADATSANGGWYHFKTKDDPNQWKWATTVRGELESNYFKTLKEREYLTDYLYSQGGNDTKDAVNNILDLNEYITDYCWTHSTQTVNKCPDNIAKQVPPGLTDCSQK